MSTTEVARFIDIINSIVRLRQVPDSFATTYQSITQARETAEGVKKTMLSIVEIAKITSDPAKVAELQRYYNDNRVRYDSLVSKADSDELGLVAEINNFAVKNGIRVPRTRSDGSSFESAKEIITYFNDALIRSMSELVGAINPQIILDISNALESSRSYAARQTSEILRLRSYIDNTMVSRVPDYSNEEKDLISKTSFNSEMVRFGSLSSGQVLPQPLGPYVMDTDDSEWIFVRGIIPLLTFAPLLYLSHPNLISILEIKMVSQYISDGYRLRFEEGLELFPRVKRGPAFDRNEYLRVPNESVIVSSILSLMEFLTNHGITFEWLSLSDFSIVASNPQSRGALGVTGRVVLRNFTRAIYCGDGDNAFTVPLSDVRNIIERSINREGSDFLELLSSVLGADRDDSISYARISDRLPSDLVRRNLFFTALLIEQLRRPMIIGDIVESIHSLRVSDDFEQMQAETLDFCSRIVSNFDTAPALLKEFFNSASVKPEFATIAEEYKKGYSIETCQSCGTAVQRINKASITTCSEIMNLLSLLLMMIAVDLNLTYTQYFALIDFLYLHADQIRESLNPDEKKILTRIVRRYQTQSPFVTSEYDICDGTPELQHKIGAFITIGLKAVLDVFGYNKHIPDVDWQQKIFSFFCTTQSVVDGILHDVLVRRSGTRPMALFGEPVFPRLSSEITMFQMLKASTTCGEYRQFLDMIVLRGDLINASIQQHSPSWSRVAYRNGKGIPVTEFYNLLSKRLRNFNDDIMNVEMMSIEEVAGSLPMDLSPSSTGEDRETQYSNDEGGQRGLATPLLRLPSGFEAEENLDMYEEEQ